MDKQTNSIGCEKKKSDYFVRLLLFLLLRLRDDDDTFGIGRLTVHRLFCNCWIVSVKDDDDGDNKSVVDLRVDAYPPPVPPTLRI